MTEILTSEIHEALARLAVIEPNPSKRDQIIDAATQAYACGGESFLSLVDVLGKIMSSARLTAEDMHQMRRRGIDITPAIETIRRQAIEPLIHRTRLWQHRPTGMWEWSCDKCGPIGSWSIFWDWAHEAAYLHSHPYWPWERAEP